MNTCSTCHVAAGPPGLNPYGNAFLGSGHNLKTIEPLDSDADGFTNIAEITARTFPGDPASHPAPDTTAPVVSTFTMPTTASSLTVAISAFIATDNVAVTGYLATDSATAPLASAAGWSATAPASYTFATAGAKTLYAWAKDAAGNVSTSRSASVTITLSSGNYPKFTDPGEIANNYLPLEELGQDIFKGTVGGHRLRLEPGRAHEIFSADGCCGCGCSSRHTS